MKNKKNIYFLIPAVLLVWGIIGYRIFSSINPKEKTVKLTEQIEKFHPKKTIKKDRYVLMTNYRDPFFGTIANLNIKERSRPKVIKEKIVFPNIVYKGVVSSKTKKNSIYLITINDKQEMFKLKETHQEVKLIKGNRGKITLKYKSEIQVYYLKI